MFLTSFLSRQRHLHAQAALCVAAVLMHGAPQAAPITPSLAQYTAKLYTEIFGRIPDQAGWQAALNYWSSGACTAVRLEAQGVAFFTSAEFHATTTSNPERVFKLYRAVFHRDPDQMGFDAYVQHLNAGTPWVDVVRAFYRSPEFQQRVSSVCNGPSFGWHAATPPTYVYTATASFRGGTGAQLQAVINSTAAGGTVRLEQGAVVSASDTIVVGRNITLETVNTPPRSASPRYGRILRGTDFQGPLLRLETGATLRHVWVDGQRSRFENTTWAGKESLEADKRINVLAAGGNISVLNNIMTDATGWTNLQFLGRYELGAAGCAQGKVIGNLITAYGSRYGVDRRWSDGLSIGCEDSLIENNHIVDATDVSIVVFRAHPAIQRSVVRGNSALNAGNNAYGMLGVDPLFYTSDGKHLPVANQQFVGTEISSNTLWASPAVFVQIPLAIGTRPWFESTGCVPDTKVVCSYSNLGYGGTFKLNTSGSQSIRSISGIVVSGMLDVNVTGNTLTRVQHSLSNNSCPQLDVAASLTAGKASGTIQGVSAGGVGDVDVRQCITP